MSVIFWTSQDTSRQFGISLETTFGLVGGGRSSRHFQLTICTGSSVPGVCMLPQRHVRGDMVAHVAFLVREVATCETR